MKAPRSSRISLALALVPALLAVVGGIGFVFHTDFDPQVFGKYRGGYFAFLLAYWILFVPLVFVVSRWVFTTQRIELPSGRVLHWRPAPKILLVLVLGVLFVSAANARIHKATGRGVATPLRSDTFHPYLQNAPAPYHHRFGINRWGFRGTDIEREKPEGEYRVFLLGGSTLFAAALPLEETPGELLETQLRAAVPGRAFEVQNAAAEWHCSEHSLIKFLTWIRSFDPDLVVVYHAINDLYRSFTPEAFAVGPYRDDYGHFHGAVASLVRPKETKWMLVRMQAGYWFSDFRYDRVRVAGPTGDGVKGVTQMFFPKSEEVEIPDWPSLGAFERNLTDLVSAIRRAGVDVVVGSQPSLYREDLTREEREVVWFAKAHQENGRRASIASMADGMRRFNEVSRAVAERAGVPFVDLDAAVPKTTEYLYDDVHYTAKGAARVAESLTRAVVRRAAGPAGLPDPGARGPRRATEEDR